RPPRRVAAFVFASLLTGALAGSAVALWIRTAVPGLNASAPVTHLDLILPSELELYTAANQAIAISPDGREVAFVAASCGLRHVFIRRFEERGTVARRIRGTDFATQIFFSPDGRSLGYTSTDGRLNAVSLSDDSISVLTDSIDITGGGTWGVDGRITFAK